MTEVGLDLGVFYYGTVRLGVLRLCTERRFGGRPLRELIGLSHVIRVRHFSYHSLMPLEGLLAEVAEAPLNLLVVIARIPDVVLLNSDFVQCFPRRLPQTRMSLKDSLGLQQLIPRLMKLLLQFGNRASHSLFGILEF